MAKSKYITLSTGYKVNLDDPKSDEHLVHAIVGECLTEIRNTTNPFDTLDNLGDATARRMYQECEYLNRRYELCLWRLLGEALEYMSSVFELREKREAGEDEDEDEDADCDNCEHRHECAQKAQEDCSSENLN
jgi:hypothetical protein